MVVMATRDTFGGFTFAGISSKIIPIVVAVMISLDRVLMTFFYSKLLIYL